MAMKVGRLRCVSVLLMVSPVLAQAATPALVPIGGDYNTVGSFVEVVLRNASGRSVDISVIPSTYAETKAEAVDNGDYDLALEHVASLAAECEARVDHHHFPEGCRVGLVDLFERGDASNAAIVQTLTTTDGAFILGGDQGAGMVVLAGTPAERALAAAYRRGAVVGGTSAGNAVLSRTMNNGYTDFGDYSVALQLGALDLWFGDAADPLHRGMSFGVTKAILDQHLYERGRFGRLLNEVARTADHNHTSGLVGIGVDTDTAPVLRHDRIESIFGPSSLTIIDYRTAGATWSWVDSDGHPVADASPDTTPTAALSARNVLVHVLPPKSAQGRSAVTFDLDTRAVTLNGRPVAAGRQGHGGCDGLTTRHPLIIGGDLSAANSWPEDSKVLRELTARANPRGALYLVAAGYGAAADAQPDLDAYTTALGLSGWAGPVTARIYPAPVSNAELSASAAVIFLAPNQNALPALLADRGFVQLVHAASRLSPIIMLDRSSGAAAGDVYDAIDDASDSIEAYKSTQANVQPGLGLVSSARPVSFEPRLQTDYRHGRLFGIPFATPATRPLVYGISEGSALLVTRNGATVIGENPVLRSDTSGATFYTGDTSAFGVINAIIDVFEPSQRTHKRLAPVRVAPSLLTRDSSDRLVRQRR